MTDESKPEKKKGGLFGSIISWANKAKDAATDALNSEKAKAAIEEMKKRAADASQKAAEIAKATTDKAMEAAKTAEQKAHSMMNKDASPKEDKKNDPDKLD